MIATAHLRVEPCLISGENVQALRTILVSCVKHAKDTATRDYNADEIIESIRTEKHFKLRQSVEDIRRTFGSVMTDTGSNRKAAKEAVAQAKKMLPGVLWSGRFRNRRE